MADKSVKAIDSVAAEMVKIVALIRSVVQEAGAATAQAASQAGGFAGLESAILPGVEAEIRTQMEKCRT